MTFTQIMYLAIGVLVVACIVDNMFGGGNGKSSKGGYTIGDYRKLVDKI